MPQALAFHWAKPFRDEMSAVECDYLFSGQCYGDTSFAGVQDMFRIFLIDGEEALWTALQDQYEWMVGSEDDYLSGWRL